MLGTDLEEVEVLCNWFKVDAISPVPLKGGLKKILLEERQREEKEWVYKETTREERDGGKTLYLAVSQGVCDVS